MALRLTLTGAFDLASVFVAFAFALDLFLEPLGRPGLRFADPLFRSLLIIQTI